MSSSRLGDTPPGYSGDIEVTKVRRRIRWGSERSTCSNCGSTVELGESHHYVEVARQTRSGKRIDPENHVFCNRGCLREWFEADER